jgi:hypothetical protein
MPRHRHGRAQRPVLSIFEFIDRQRRCKEASSTGSFISRSLSSRRYDETESSATIATQSHNQTLSSLLSDKSVPAVATMFGVLDGLFTDGARNTMFLVA